MTELLAENATENDPSMDSSQITNFATTISASAYVSHVYTVDRGYAAEPGTAHDLDFVVAVRDDQFTEFLAVLDALMINAFGVLLPGWRDRTARSFGAIETVYLVPVQGVLWRWRVRLVPSSSAANVPERIRASLVYREEEAKTTQPAVDPMPDLLAESELLEPSAEDSFIDTLVHLHSARDSIRGGRFLQTYGEITSALAALKNVVRSSTGLRVSSSEWDGLDEGLSTTAIGRRCLTELRDLVLAKTPANTIELAELVVRALRLTETAAPEVQRQFAGPIDSYRKYLDAW